MKSISTQRSPVAVLAVLVAAAAGCRGFGERHDVGNDSAAGASGQIVCLNPPGLVATPEFAAFPAPGQTARSIPVKWVTLPANTVRLREALDLAYDLERIRSIPEASQLDVAVLRRRGPIDDYLPLPLVLRYPLGDFPVADGDLVGLVAWSLAGVTFSEDAASDNGDAPHPVTITGLVEAPGTHWTDELQINAVVGDRELPAGEFLKQTSGLPFADLLIVTRISENHIRRIYLPNETSVDVYALERESFWDRFSGFQLQSGDGVVAARASLLPEILARIGVD